jgi:hypothetical protein
MKTSKIEAKNKSKTFLSSKMETAMNEKYIDLMETSINEKNFHIEEWERTKAMLRGELESRNLKIPSFGKKNMADFIIHLLHQIDYLEEKNSCLKDKNFE